jgi:hypothetical protein
VIAGGEQDKKPEPKLTGLDFLFRYLNVHRDRLLAILHRSIELNEPLYCSLWD